jgi:hypothetical protein
MSDSSVTKASSEMVVIRQAKEQLRKSISQALQGLSKEDVAQQCTQF